jgi:hypothetical protein
MALSKVKTSFKRFQRQELRRFEAMGWFSGGRAHFLRRQTTKVLEKPHGAVINF